MANSFNINTCRDRGCNKIIEGVACGAYKDPTQTIWHRNDKLCPVAKWVPTMAERMAILGHVRKGQQKQS